MRKKEKKNEFIKKGKLQGNKPWLILLLLFILASYIQTLGPTYEHKPYTSFMVDLKKYNVKTVDIKEDSVIYTLNDGEKYKTDNPKTENFKETLLLKDVRIVKEISIYYSIGSYIKVAILLCNLLLILYMILRKTKNLGTLMSKDKNKWSVQGEEIEENNSLNKDEPKKEIYTFDNVAGCEEAKEALMDVSDWIKNRDKLIEFGVKAPKGILLEGEPGNGKTLLAKALATECKLPFYYTCGSEFTEKYVGVGASRIRDLFKTLRKNAPSILFLDEIDSIGKTRGSDMNSERDATLNQILVEMDGVSDLDGVFIIAATNRADMLDSALKRSGRFDRTITVPYPDIVGREKILRIHGKDKMLDETVDFKKIAKATPGFSGADLENLLNQSGLVALKGKQKSISSKNIDIAIDNIIVGGGFSKSRIHTKNDINTAAYHEVGHALSTYFLAHKTIEKISILPSMKALGYVMPTQSTGLLKTYNDYLGDIYISLAGKAAEEVIFKKENISAGCSQDLINATNIARRMVYTLGMTSFGLTSVDNSSIQYLSESSKNKAETEINSILNNGYELVLKFFKENEYLLHKVTNKVKEKEVMFGEDFERFLREECNVEFSSKFNKFKESKEKELERLDYKDNGLAALN